MPSTISFVIPAYNESRYIHGCIDAIVRATAANGLKAEIIVVDNGSQDDTAALARAAGAAVISANGDIYQGCNVENATYGAACCAERTAVFSAVAAGHRAFRAVAVLTNGAAPGTPCGICRQVLAEFGNDLDVLCFTPDGAEQHYRLSELLPHAFTLK